MEKYICGVFASKEVAERECVAQGESGGHGPFTASRWDDGDIYLDDASGHRRYVIQAHRVTYRPRARVESSAAGE